MSCPVCVCWRAYVGTVVWWCSSPHQVQQHQKVEGRREGERERERDVEKKRYMKKKKKKTLPTTALNEGGRRGRTARAASSPEQINGRAAARVLLSLLPASTHSSSIGGRISNDHDLRLG
ncbi:unnamed protein product [Musa acuminata subsp. burmannicoides]